MIAVKCIDNKYFKKNPQMNIQDVSLIINRRYLVSANFITGTGSWLKVPHLASSFPFGYKVEAST